MEKCSNNACGCCSPVEQAPVSSAVPANTSYETIAYAENMQLQKQIDDLIRENSRLTYMASGYTALILETKDAKMIARAAEIALEANKLY